MKHNFLLLFAANMVIIMIEHLKKKKLLRYWMKILGLTDKKWVLGLTEKKFPVLLINMVEENIKLHFILRKTDETRNYFI